MSRIKTRESVKDIKVIDKAAVASERMKTALVRSKDQFENLMDDGQVTPSEYAEDKIRYAAEDVADRVGHEVSSETKKAVNKGKEAYRQHREEKRIEKNEERGQPLRRAVSQRGTGPVREDFFSGVSFTSIGHTSIRATRPFADAERACIQTSSCLSEAKQCSAEEECLPAEHRKRNCIYKW